MSRELLVVEVSLEQYVVGSITINSNNASLNAQRRFGRSTRALQDSFTSLSSGLRINRASDDAAGLAIAESLKVNARVFSQGVRNLNDGISLLSIADAALNELSSITVRLAELAEQAANGALGSTQRGSLNEEAQALRAEYFRIAKTTEFNGEKIFDSTFGDLRLQSGYGANGAIVDGLGGAIGTGSFQAAMSFETEGIAFETVAADFNHDGILDLAASDNSDSSISILLGNGDGSFKGRRTFEAGGGTNALEGADFNNDGIMDLIATNYDDGTVSVFIGNGDGAFSSSALAVGAQPFSVTVDGFNNDGFQDFATANFDSFSSVFLGTGNGTFSAVQSLATGTRPRDIVTADVNKDGLVDLVTADFNSDTVTVLLGVGDGTFGASSSYDVGNGPASLAVGDLNNDGYADIVTAEVNSGDMSVLFGAADGSFSGLQAYAAGGGAKGVKLADLNGDGALDAIVASRDEDSATVLLGRGDGTFEEGTDFLAGDVNEVTIADFNQDGVYDILTADRNRQTVSILLAETESGVSPLVDFSLETMAEARQTLPMLSDKLDHLAAQRGQIGAFEARISAALATTRVATENFSAAQSQILDADVAKEAAGLVRNQILQQAGAAVLSQANQGPALALQLLG